MGVFPRPVIPGIEQNRTSAFSKHANITHGISDRGRGFLGNTQPALEHLDDGSLAVHLHLIPTEVTDACRRRSVVGFHQPTVGKNMELGVKSFRLFPSSVLVNASPSSSPRLGGRKGRSDVPRRLLQTTADDGYVHVVIE